MSSSEENRVILAIRHKCRIAALRFRSSDDATAPQRLREKDWDMYVSNRDSAVSEALTLTDSFSRAFAFHSIVEVLVVAGEDETARDMLNEIDDQDFRAKAEADFHAGAEHCFRNLAGGSRVVYVTSPPPARAKLQEENSLAKRIGAVVTVLAFLVAFGLFVPMGSIGREWYEQLTTSDAQIRAEIEKDFQGTTRLFTVIKVSFPAEYEQFTEGLISDVRKKVPTVEIRIKSTQFFADLRKKNAINFVMADVQSLRQNLALQVPVYDYLKHTYGAKACVAMYIGGGQMLIKEIGPKFSEDKTLMGFLDEIGGNFFEVAARGIVLRQRHDEPRDADWQVYLQTLSDAGFSQQDLELLAKPQDHIDDPRLCDVGKASLAGLTEMTVSAADRLIPFIAAEAGAQ